jgi:5-methylcytosine-specific restriction endonuclease McrA
MMCSAGHRYTPTSKHSRCPVCARDKERYADPHRQVLSSYAWQKARKAARARDGNRCVCTDDGDCHGQLEVHHLISVRRGGDPFALDNLVTVCRAHHEVIETQQCEQLRDQTTVF